MGMGVTSVSNGGPCAAPRQGDELTCLEDKRKRTLSFNDRETNRRSSFFRSALRSWSTGSSGSLAVNGFARHKGYE